MANVLDVGIMKNCYATLWSYGEICVGCNCCGRINKDKRKIIKAKLNYCREELHRLCHFNSWGDTKDIVKLQEKNIKTDKKSYRQEIKKLKAQLTKKPK